ncbi:MAG: hypothetical protein EA365_08205 [Gloeocapsa sp. DLM2.Bin57]|nr:MAG: hypothetical protein EA365_08205 [Gloeocapsa sp. DLM2.Bin57]
MVLAKINKIIHPTNQLEVIGLILIALGILFGFFTRIIAVFTYNTFDIGPDPDQIRDAFIYMGIWSGKFPHLGPWASQGNYYLPPLYYYLVFPFTIFGPNPVYQALANGVFSFLSILLLMYLVYLLLPNLARDQRIFLAGVAGFWYSTIFPEIFISNFNFNPSPTPFFLLLFVLLYNYQMTSQASLPKQVIAWIASGIVLAILVSLHSSTLFVMPVVFIITSLWFIYQKRQDKYHFLLPIVAVIATNLALLLYWKIEIASNFNNSRKIRQLITSSSEQTSLWSKLLVIKDYLELGQQAYFIGESSLSVWLSAIFIVAVTLLGLIKFKGNQVILGCLMLTWLIFLYAAANFQGQYFFITYKLLILFAPIIFTVLTLGNQFIPKVVKLIIIGLIVLSISINLHHTSKYLASKYGQHRVMAVNDVVNILAAIPPESRICYPEKTGKREVHNQYDYLDTYITKRNLIITPDCQQGDYYISAKYKLVIPLTNIWPVLEIEENNILFEQANLFLDTSTAYVYPLDK